MMQTIVFISCAGSLLSPWSPHKIHSKPIAITEDCKIERTIHKSYGSEFFISCPDGRDYILIPATQCDSD